MDDQRFDAWLRAQSSSGSRRRVLRLAAGLAALALAPTNTAARQREPGDEPGSAPPSDSDGDRAADCPGVLCHTTCCPPETVGCAEIKLPDGTMVVGCLQPDGGIVYPGIEPPTECHEGYVLQEGWCVWCAEAGCQCDADRPCCEGVCCDGTCWPPEFECCGGSPCCTGGSQVCEDGKCRCANGQSYCPACDIPIAIAC
jgi:hypothetical protein